MKDPLSGQRELINKGNGSSLFWTVRSSKAPCPVEIGDFFALRGCGIEITRKERVTALKWRADFIRIHKAEPELLLKRGGGTTTDLDLAMRSQEDTQAATTLDAVDPEDRSEAHRAAGEPPEGAIVPYHRVLEFKPSREAQQRYLRETAEQRVEEANAPLPVRLHRLSEMARSRHVDLSSEERVIKRRIEAMERKIADRAA
jgi:hypothetical protein